jgi:hypothetical protein
LWENAIGKVQDRLKTRTMFGTIGHETELSDLSIAEGKVSHITTNVFIDENNQGIGEALILNTPAGKVLNTLLRAGSELYVSSRAEGRFSGNKDGIPAVDENVYNLIGWDFVLNPGFLKANPKLAEEYSNLENNQGDKEMGTELLEKLTRENLEIKQRLEESTTKLSAIEEALAPLKEENAHLTAQLGESEKIREELTKQNEELVSIKETVEEYADSVEEFVEALQKSGAYIESIHEEIGSKEEITKALELAESFRNEVNAIGDIAEIKKVLEFAEKVIDEKIEAERQAEIKDLAEEYSVKAELVEKLLSKNEKAEVIEILKEMQESVKAAAPAAPVETKEVVGEKETTITESADKKRLNRLMSILP